MAFVSAQSDPFEDFLKMLELKVRHTNFDACNKLSYDQSMAGPSLAQSEVITLDSCMQYGHQMSTKLLSDFRRIAQQEVEKVSTNPDGQYYEFDHKTKLWYLPNKALPNAC